jgi:hypothetical protein
MAYTNIDDPSAYFQTALYTGNGGTLAVLMMVIVIYSLIWFGLKKEVQNFTPCFR